MKKNKILKLTLSLKCKIIIIIFLALYICICYLMSYEVGISDIEYIPLCLKLRNMCYIFIIKLFFMENLSKFDSFFFTIDLEN